MKFFQKSICSALFLLTIFFLGIPRLYAENPLKEDIFDINKKDPLQTLLESQGFTFSSISYVPVKTIFPAEKKEDIGNKYFLKLSEEQSIPLEIKTEKSEIFKVGETYTFELPEENTIIITLQNFKEEEKIEKNSSEDLKLTLSYQGGTRKIYHNLTNIILKKAPSGQYQIMVEHPYYFSYDVQVDLASENFPEGGTIFIGPEKTFSDEFLKQLVTFVKKGGNLLIVSNNQVAEKFGVNFETKKVQNKLGEKEKSLFMSGEKVEYIEVNGKKRSQSAVIIETEDGSLVQKLYYPKKDGGFSEILIFSKDIFRLEKEDIMEILAKVTALPSNPATNVDTINAAGAWSGILGVLKEKAILLKIITLLLILSILGLLFGESFWNFLKQKEKKSIFNMYIHKKSQSLRNIIIRHFYRLIAGVFLIAGIFGLMGYYTMRYLYQWYTTSSGLDLLPNFKIDDFLSSIGIQTKISVSFLIIIAILTFVLLFLVWLLWDRVKKFANIFTTFIEGHGLFRKFSTKIFILFTAFCCIFLYSLFFRLPGRSLFLLGSIFLGVLLFLVHAKSETTDWEVTLANEKQKITFRILQWFILGLPAMLLFAQLAPLLKTKAAPEIRISAGENEAIQRDRPYSLINGKNESMEIGKQVTLDGKNYRLISEFPLLLRIAPDQIPASFTKGRSGTITLEARLRGNTPIKITTGAPQSPDSKTAKHLLFLPILSIYKHIQDIDTFSFFIKNFFINDEILGKISSEKQNFDTKAFLEKILPPMSVISLVSNNEEKKERKIKQMDFIKDRIDDATEEYKEFSFNLLSKKFIFFSYFKEKAYILMYFKQLNQTLGKEKLQISVKNKENEEVFQEDFELQSEVLGSEGKLQVKAIVLDDLPEGIYSISLKDLSAVNDAISPDYILAGMKINSSKLVLQGDPTSYDGDMLFFKNLTPKLTFTPSFDTKLSFFELGGNVRALSNQKSLKTLDDIDVNPDEMWRIQFPQTGGTLKSQYNFYALSEETWFYPYEYFFTNINDRTDLIITSNYEKPKKDRDFFITKAHFDRTEVVPCGKEYCFFIDSFDYDNPLIILDWIKITIQ